MKYNIISSSSKGNAIIFEDFLLLDVGVSYVKLKPYLNKIKIIFISHEHVDHLQTRTIKQLVYNYPNIKYLTGSLGVVNKLYKCGVKTKNIILISNLRWWDLGSIQVKLEPLYHDVDNYALKWKYKDKRIIYAVDTNRIDHIEAKDYDLYLIESNYNKDLLEKHIQECIDNNDEENKLFYLERTKRTHLSSEDCTSFLLSNMGENSKFERIHKSSYNYEEKD